MITFLEMLHLLIWIVLIILLLLYIFSILKKDKKPFYFLLVSVLFAINIFVDNKLCDSITKEISREINSSDKIFFIDSGKKKFITKKTELYIHSTSQRQYYKEKEYILLIHPQNVQLILREDSKIKGKFWVKYPKYYVSKIKAVGYLEIDFLKF